MSWLLRNIFLFLQFHSLLASYSLSVGTRGIGEKGSGQMGLLYCLTLKDGCDTESRHSMTAELEAVLNAGITNAATPTGE